MPDFEKVLRGLDCCVNMLDCHDCCPYHPTDKCEKQQLLKDAFAILNAQRPRVMTANEVINHIGPIYFEVNGDEELNGWVLFRGAVPAYSLKVKMVMQSRNQYCMMDDYGKNWRCWTTRPNREQRKAVKWDDDRSHD